MEDTTFNTATTIKQSIQELEGIKTALSASFDSSISLKDQQGGAIQLSQDHLYLKDIGGQAMLNEVDQLIAAGNDQFEKL